MITHVVAFKYKPNTPYEYRKDLAFRLLALGDSSGSIKSIVGGHESGPERLGKGFHHVFVMKFNVSVIFLCDVVSYNFVVALGRFTLL